MPTYNPPLRDMQFVIHEVFNVVDELKQVPKHADIDADTINAVLEEGGKFASEVLARHDENYMPKEVADAIKNAGQWKDTVPGRPTVAKP